MNKSGKSFMDGDIIAGRLNLDESGRDKEPVGNLRCDLDLGVRSRKRQLDCEALPSRLSWRIREITYGHIGAPEFFGGFS